MASNEAQKRYLSRLIVPSQSPIDSSVDNEMYDRSQPYRSSISSIDIQRNSRPSIVSTASSYPTPSIRSMSRQTDRSNGNLTNSSDDEDDSGSARENYRFAPQIIRTHRDNSNYSIAQQKHQASTSNKSDVLTIQAPPSGSITLSAGQNDFQNGCYFSLVDKRAIALATSIAGKKDLRGNTLLHLAARLGHEEILRLLMCETSQASMLMNMRGQTPLLAAIEAGSTNAAILLMESDPRSIIVSDNNGSSMFHYACEYSNNVVLNRAIALLKRLNSTSDRITGLRRITERNRFGKTPFDIAIEKGQLKCIKQFLVSPWLDANIDIRELFHSNALRTAIDQNQLDILTFFVTDIKRFAYIMNLLIDVQGVYLNLLEYAIYLKKKDIVRLFISVRIPIDQSTFRQQYKSFLQHYSESFVQPNMLSFYQTPVQRMLTTPECVPLVPLILEQFVNNNELDFSIIDDCLYARPGKTRCIFGRSKNFSARNWLQQHPLTLVTQANCNAVYDHPLVRTCVDLKFSLFGNFLYFLIFCCLSSYVALYTGIALGSPTPAAQGSSYYIMYNYSCTDLCLTLVNDPANPLQDHSLLRALRFILLIISALAILKQFYQIINLRGRSFRELYIDLVELHMYVSAIIYSVDVNECTRETGVRCSVQWMVGGIGLLSVWTSLLLVLMNGIKFGKHGLLFITVFVTFLKFIAVYIFIWIGYILAFYMICKDILYQFHFFNFVPKLLAMFIGEYDLDSTFFPNNETMPGTQAALILYSAYIFTMFIVMTNIMGGLAVADVKQFRLNAKREHLKARIGVVLGLQAYVGVLCETIASTIAKFSKNEKWLRFLAKSKIVTRNCQLEKLEIRSNPVTVPHNFSASYSAPLITQALYEQDIFGPAMLSTPDVFDQVYPEAGFYIHFNSVQNEALFIEDENTRLSKKTNEIRDTLEESTIRTNNEFRKITLDLQNELEDIKRRLIQ